MPLSINDTLQNNSPKPLDNKYGIFSTGVFRPYASIAEANATVPAAYRSVGLTVVVATVSGNTEYWYQGGISDGNLVSKGTIPTVNSPLTLSGGSISIQQANGSQAGYLGTSDWALFNGKLSNIASVGSGISLYSSTSAGVANVKSLIGAGGLVITDGGTSLTLTIPTYTGTNIGTGANLYTTNLGTSLQLRSIIGGTGVTVIQNALDITLSIAGQNIPTPVTTVNTTPSTLSTLTIPNGAAGMVVVTVVALVSGNPSICSMAQRYAKYYKNSSGTLTIVETGDTIAESLSTLTTASWTIAGVSNNIAVQITGEGTNNIKWSATIQNYTNS